MLEKCRTEEGVGSRGLRSKAEVSRLEKTVAQGRGPYAEKNHLGGGVAGGRSRE